MPDQVDMEHERNMMIVATKGVVELFNAVTAFQTQQVTDAKSFQKNKDVKYQDAVQKVGEDKKYNSTSNENIYKKLQDKSVSKWSVLNNEEGEDSESDIDSEGNIKIKDIVDE